MTIILVIIYFLIAFVSYFICSKISIKKYKNATHTSDFQIICLFWPLGILLLIILSPIYIYDKIDEYNIKKFRQSEDFKKSIR